ncbi:MAG: hypothetical protein NZ560_04990 [Aquificaceae bacterium]|nr:hypothetical protein [Aquificaceae bacterium]
MRKYILLLLATVSVGQASAFVKSEGELFLSPSFYYYRASKFYDREGNRRDIGCKFTKREVQLYGEYGLTEKTTLTFKLPYAQLECGADRTSRLGDLEVGFVRNLRRDKSSSLSTYGTLLVPTGYSIQDNLRLGYGRLGAEGGLLYGLSGKGGFFDSGLGYRYYFGYPSSHVRGYLSGAYSLASNLQLYSMLDAQIGLGDGKTKRVGRNLVLEPDYKLLQAYVGPRLILGSASVLVGYQRVLWGRKTGDGSGFFMSLWYGF